MFEDMARMRFFIPKPFMKAGRHTDKYPFVVMESVAEGQNVICGKFPDEENAKLFLKLLREIFVKKMQSQMEETIEQTLGEQSK